MLRLVRAATEMARSMHSASCTGCLGAAHTRHILHNVQRSTVPVAAAARTYVTARLGERIQDIETPSLLVDLDVFERNCLKLQSVMQGYPNVSIRPHAKAHKCPQIAQLQLRLLGPAAKGVCCQKVSEAEAMVAGGVTDVFVSNEVVDHNKINRLVALAAQGAHVSVVVDAPGPLQQLAAAAASWQTSVDVLVEINAGQDRCGVDSPDAAAHLAEQIATLQSTTSGAVHFTGIQAYHGGLQHVRDPKQRAAAVARVVDLAAAAVDAISSKAGLQCSVVTGGGSGTYRLEAESGVFNEVQPGSFAFGDADYSRNYQADGSQGEWEQALWVLTQVMSVSSSRSCAVVDAGLKAVSLDSGPPLLLERPNVAARLVAPPPGSSSSSRESSSSEDSRLPMISFEGVEFQNGGDEHGKLLWPQGLHQMPAPQLPPIGVKLLLQPGHCDPTVNMYDSIVAVRGDKVVGVWHIAARGPGL